MGGGRNGGVDIPLTARNERTRGASGSRRLCTQGLARARSASNVGVAVTWGVARSVAAGGVALKGARACLGAGVARREGLGGMARRA
jgi:hypothetical protein